MPLWRPPPLPAKRTAWLRAAPWVAVLVAAGGCFGPDIPAAPASHDVQVQLHLAADGFDRPVGLLLHPDGRLFVLEQAGRIVALVKGAPGDPEGWSAGATLLDIAGRVLSGGERGLLGATFDDEGTLYVHYSSRPLGNTTLSRFVDGDETVLLTVRQPYANHNGGTIAFGPAGMLYMGLGDGGSAGDPHGNGQDKDTLLGKILRLDVSCSQPPCTTYANPPDNPFVGKEGRDEIWAYGLRNPWRFSFDRASGDLWIGDVGQNRYEEVDRIPAARGGANLGWGAYEGRHRTGTGDAPGHLGPVAEYDHDGGHYSVTGGHVYRGAGIPDLAGRYVSGDYCRGTLWALRQNGTRWDSERILDTGLRVVSFGEDAAGELWVVDHGGGVHRLVAAATPAAATPPTAATASTA